MPRKRTSSAVVPGAGIGAPMHLFEPRALRSMVIRPAYLEVSAWIEHIPFAFWLIEAHQPRTMVELGTHYGTSYFAFCQAVERLGLDTRCFAVDTWKGDDHSGLYGEDVFEAVSRYNDAQYSGFSRLIRSTFDAACRHFSDRSIDLLHIDGYHSLEAVTHDFETWLPKLSERAVVLLHDTNVRERDFGVFRLFEELQAEYPAFEFVHGHGLGVLGVGPDQNDPLKQLFRSGKDEQACRVVHDVFGRLGRACADAHEASRLKVALESWTGAARMAQQELTDAQAKLAAAQAATAAERDKTLRLEGELAIRTHAAEEAERSLSEVRHQLAQTESALAQSRHEAEETAGALAATRGDLRQSAVARAEAEKVSARLKQYVGLLMADVKERQAAFMAEQQARAAEAAETDNAIAAMARQVKQVLAVLDTSLHEMTTRFHQAEQTHARQCAEFEGRLHQQAGEIETLRRLLDDRQGAAQNGQAQAKPVRQLAAGRIRHAVAGLLNGHGTALSWRPFHFRRQVAHPKRSGLFDGEWYLRAYADVARSGIDPLRHYLEFGAREGRAPNAALAHLNGKEQHRAETMPEPDAGPQPKPDSAVSDALKASV